MPDFLEFLTGMPPMKLDPLQGLGQQRPAAALSDPTASLFPAVSLTLGGGITLPAQPFDPTVSPFPQPSLDFGGAASRGAASVPGNTQRGTGLKLPEDDASRAALGLAPKQKSGQAAQDQQATANASQPGTQPTANARAPVSQGTPTAPAGSQTAFFQQMQPIAAQVASETGIPAEFLLAIAANETGSGGSVVGNNYFGIKATGNEPQSGPVSTWESVGGQRQNTRASFRTYDDPTQSFRDFSQFLHDNPRYGPALANYARTQDPAQFIREVHGAGYATDPNWGNQVISLAERARLATAGLGPPATPGSPVTTGGPIITETGGANAALANSPTAQAARLTGVSQNELGLPASVAAAFCGPAAAIAWAQMFGRPPTAVEAMNLARESGWSEQAGQAGPQAQVALMQRMGVPARTASPTPATIAAELTAGRPVILSSPGSTGHYFQLIGYDPTTDRYQFGDAVGRSRAPNGAPLSAIPGMGFGTPNTAIYLGGQ